MKAIMDALTEWLTIAVVFATQGMLIISLALLVFLLVAPEHPLLSQCLKFLKGLV